MSPEQMRGEKLDARTDLFSFGLVLYEMAARRRAFKGVTARELRREILTRTLPNVRTLNPKIPRQLERIITKAVEKDRLTRYQTASELRVQLQALARETESRRSLRRWVPASTAALLLVSAGVIFWSAKRVPTSSRTLAELKLRQLTVNSSENPVNGGAISPDGKYLAYSDWKGMHTKLIGSDEAQSVPQPEILKNGTVHWEVPPTAWFPDSKGFLANAHPSSESRSEWSSETTSAWVVSAGGGVPRKLRDHAVAERGDKMPACVGWIEKKHFLSYVLNQAPVLQCARLLGEV